MSVDIFIPKDLNVDNFQLKNELNLFEDLNTKIKNYLNEILKFLESNIKN